MPIPITVTDKEYRKARLLLRKEKEVVCLDRAAHTLYLLVARDLLLSGQNVNARIVKGY